MNQDQRNYLALDLELEQPSKEIIQVGTAVFCLDTEQFLERKTWYITLGKPLSQFITDLTGITDEDLNTKGVSLKQMYSELTELHKKYSCCVNPVTWGGGDHRCLRAALGLSEDDPYLFGHREIDSKTIFQSWRRALRQPVQGGLAKSMLKLGLKFDGRKHDAGSDAFNTARVYMALLKKFRA